MLKLKLTPEEEKQFCDEFIRFFKEEKDEDIGIIQSQIFLDFFLKTTGTKIYNKGIETSKNLIEEKLEELNFNLEELKR